MDSLEGRILWLLFITLQSAGKKRSYFLFQLGCALKNSECVWMKIIMTIEMSCHVPKDNWLTYLFTDYSH